MKNQRVISNSCYLKYNLMCNPAALAIIAAASAVSTFAGQRRQANLQARHQRWATKAEQQRALMAQSTLRRQQAQQEEASNREMAEVSIKSREAMSRARTSAGEAGVAGQSVANLMDDYMRQEADYRALAFRQQELIGEETGLALSDAGFQSQANLININRPINKPDFLTGALGAAQSAASGYRTGMEIETYRKETT